MTLLAALYLPIAKVAPYQRLARWAMIGYTTLTLLLWMAIGMWTLVGSFWPPSLAHYSCAQVRATSSGMGLGGRGGRSRHPGKPRTSSTHCLSLPS